MQRCRNRRLNHIITSRTLAKRFLIPLERAQQQCLTSEKDKSWFPKLPMLGYFIVLVQFQSGLFQTLRSFMEHLDVQVNCLTSGFDVKLSTLSDALNSRRRLQVVRQVFSCLVLQARQQLPKTFKNFTRLAALDSTILYCVASAKWAKYRKKVNAVKGHLLFELAQSIPSQLILSVAKHHDRKYFRQFLRTGWTYVIDRAYNDYKVFADMIAEGIFFVIK
ncbi:transposase, partial [Planctomycetota bacterium]